MKTRRPVLMHGVSYLELSLLEALQLRRSSKPVPQLCPNIVVSLMIYYQHCKVKANKKHFITKSRIIELT